MKNKHAFALGAALLSASAFAQESTPAPNASAPNTSAQQAFARPIVELGRPGFLTKEKLEALGAQNMGQMAAAMGQAAPQATVEPQIDEAALVAAAAAAAREQGQSGNGIPLPPLPEPDLSMGKVAEKVSAPSKAPTGQPQPNTLPQMAKAPEVAPIKVKRVFDGRPESTPKDLQWGYEGIHRQEARWAQREAEYTERYSKLGWSSASSLANPSATEQSTRNKD